MVLIAVVLAGMFMTGVLRKAAPAPEAAAPVMAQTDTRRTGVSAPQQGGAEAKAGAGAVIAPELRVHLGDCRKLYDVLKQVMEVLQSARDEPSARAASARLAQLNPQVAETMNQATVSLLAVTRSSAANEQLNKFFVQANQADTDFVKQALAEVGLQDLLETFQAGNVFELMVQVARNPQASPIHGEIRRLRDIILSGRAPLAALTTRQHVEKSLGPRGSPLKTN
jgi:hypothetical protein